MKVSPPTAAELGRSVGLFLLTTASVWGIYVLNRGGPDVPGAQADGVLFAGALMSILLAHEMGHYLVARWHGFETSLPGFIPLPIPGTFGTMGAVIRLRSLPESRQALLEMGAAGPLAGAVVAFACLWYAVPLTEPGGLIEPGSVIGVYNDPLIVQLIGIVRMGAPPGRYDVYHPVAMAGWVGCLLTGINLLPIGQLDGGHVLNGLVPRLAPRLSRALLTGAKLGAGIWGLSLLWSLGIWLVATGLPDVRSPLVGEATGGLAVGRALTVWLATSPDATFVTPPAFILFLLILSRLGATVPLGLEVEPSPSRRAWLVAAAVAVLFLLTFMPFPTVMETFPPP